MSKYEIETYQGKYRIEIPADYKITFGPIAVGANRKGRSAYGADGGSMALRVYETDTKQRAIFTGVQSFRDLSIPIEREVIRVEGSENWAHEEDLDERSRKTVTERKWERIED